MKDVKKWYFDRVRPFYNNVIVIAFPRGSSKTRTQMKLLEYCLEKIGDSFSNLLEEIKKESDIT